MARRVAVFFTETWPSGRPPVARAVPNNAAAKGKWEGEDENDDGPSYSDWEASSEDDEVKAKPAAAAAAPPKKGTLKQQLAKKEAVQRTQLAAGGSDADYDEDAVLDLRTMVRLEKERELESDLHNTTELELFGSSTLGSRHNILKSSPNSKEDIVALSEAIIAHIVKCHQDKPLYSTFVEHHVRALTMPLRDVNVRKATNGLTTLVNEKQRERTSGKKPKSAAKPVLATSQVGNK
ncbi:translation initiation factor eIF3 subunit [Lactarius akahatsu]|uniref:Eukaryotic translation initiation factor 3 30 kDa subunit n=1 Tax=Lactarius akahatsu TaxID=416441 RepID=A0AAD4Q1X4_9AGAM|nr:translation initiation factor eIF3 subunit [Lactarius akahatsu]